MARVPARPPRARGHGGGGPLRRSRPLLYPPLQFAALDEFHPVTLAIPLLLFAFVFLEEDRRWLAVPFLVLAALCKEEIPLVIAVMGLYFALRKRALWPLLVTAGGRPVLPAGRGRRHAVLRRRRRPAES